MTMQSTYKVTSGCWPLYYVLEEVSSLGQVKYELGVTVTKKEVRKRVKILGIFTLRTFELKYYDNVTCTKIFREKFKGLPEQERQEVKQQLEGVDKSFFKQFGM